jgi:hypothetical protein
MIRPRLLAVVVAAGAVAVAAPATSVVAHASAGAVQYSYVVSAHPDDEYSAWSLIDKSPSNYPVFIFMTQGESSGMCVSSAAYNVGDERYPGTLNPPANNYPTMAHATTPWDRPATWAPTLPVTEATVKDPGCRQARMNSTEQFLDDMGASDPTLPRFVPGSTKIKRTCFASVPEAGKDNCAYSMASSVGALIFFDLGDDNFDWATVPYALSPNDVVWAVQRVYQNRATLGIPALSGGVHNILGAAFYNGNTPGPNATSGYATIAGGKCEVYAHWNHRAVQVALWNDTILAGVFNYGRTCTGDPDVTPTGGRTARVDATIASTTWNVTGNPATASFKATGAGSNDYGWLAGDAFPYGITAGFTEASSAVCPSGAETSSYYESEFGCVQAFWRKGGSATVTQQF